MFEIISALYTIWTYIDDANFVRKLLIVLRRYLSFLYWYIKNPEVKIKFSKLTTIKNENLQVSTIDAMYNSLLDDDYKFSDDFHKTADALNFEILQSQLSYRVKREQLTKLSESLVIETKYVPYYPLRKFNQLNKITQEYSAVYSALVKPFKTIQTNHIILVKIDVICENNNLHEINRENIEILFKGNVIQINNFQGTELGGFLMYFIMQWLREYRKMNLSLA